MRAESFTKRATAPALAQTGRSPDSALARARESTSCDRARNIDCASRRGSKTRCTRRARLSAGAMIIQAERARAADAGSASRTVMTQDLHHLA